MFFALQMFMVSMVYGEWEIGGKWVIADEWVIRGFENGNGSHDTPSWSLGFIIKNAYLGMILLSVGLIVVLALGLVLMVQEQMTITDFTILAIGLSIAIVVIFLYLVMIGQFSII